MARYRRPLLIGLLVLLLIGAAEFWLYSANRLGGFLHQRALGGVSLADLCQSSDVGGFPFRLKLTCNGFAAPLRVGDNLIFAGAEEAHGEASLFSPNHILLTLSSPLVLQKSGGGPVGKLRHDGMTIDIAWTLSGLSQAQIDVKSLDWRPESAEAGVDLHLESLAATATPETGEPRGALRFVLTGEGLTVPALQSLLKTSDLGRLAIAGAITPPPAPADDWRAAIDDWRQKAGAIAIDRLEWRAGDMNIQIAGALSLDEAHRPVGKLNVTAEGAGPLLAGLGVPPAAAQTQTAMAVLFGKAPGPESRSGALALPLTLANGQIFLGPLRLPAKVPPLY